MLEINPHSNLEPSWSSLLHSEFNKPYFKLLLDFLNAEVKAGKEIYPKDDLIFNAFNSTPFEKVKVVILGQDPYHGPNQAHGLSFSVNPGVRIPPSLRNIYKELNQDLKIDIPQHGCLQSWAEQGVLLLNATLTVEKEKAGSHQGKGWELFTDKVIQLLNENREGLIFLLWGSYAQKKGQFIDTNKHLVLKAPHPSPLSANRGFFGTKHFSKTNTYLEKQKCSKINWEPLT